MTSRERGCVAPQSLIRRHNWLSPAFPTGSYSDSRGLEWAIESQQIQDRGSLVDWLDADLRLTRSDLLVINKTDLFTNLKSGEGVEHISEFIVVKGSLEPPNNPCSR